MPNAERATRAARRFFPDLRKAAEQAESAAAALEAESLPGELAGAGFGGELPPLPLGRSVATPDRLPDYLRAGARAIEAGKEDLSPDEQLGLEAIVLLFGRPALLVQDGDFAAPPPEWSAKLDAQRVLLKEVIARVGRIELSGHPSYPWVGTGFLVAPDVLMTNRHVAVVFAQEKGGAYSFLPGVSASVDYKEEYQRQASNEFRLTEVIGIHGSYDLALLRVETTGVGGQAPLAPLAVSSQPPKVTKDLDIVVIGYPAYDSRNDSTEMLRIFENIFNVKRLQPGALTGLNPGPNGEILGHDSSSLGGCSGAPVVDLESGKVLGLHFGGRYLVGNYAVPLWKLTQDPLLLAAKVQWG